MRFSIFLLLMSLLTTATAETYEYVTDQLDLSLRTGTTTKHKIRKMVSSGTKVQVLGTADGYTKVRTPQGIEGWMLDRHLMKQPPARERVEAAEQEVALLRDENARQKAALDDPDIISPRQAELEQQLIEIRRTASGALNLAEQNRKLKRELLQQGKEAQALNQEVVTLRERSDQQWFLVGAIVVLISIFLGHLLPRMQLRRSSNLDNF